MRDARALEETGVVNARYLGETGWLTYEFPPFEEPSSHRLAKFRGQQQKWFALRFTGRDAEIDPLTPRNNQPAEFDQWRWERLDVSPICGAVQARRVPDSGAAICRIRE